MCMYMYIYIYRYVYLSLEERCCDVASVFVLNGMMETVFHSEREPRHHPSRPEESDEPEWKVHQKYVFSAKISCVDVLPGTIPEILRYQPLRGPHTHHRITRGIPIANHERPASSLPLHQVLAQVFVGFGFSIHTAEILIEDVCHATGITCGHYGEAGKVLGIGRPSPVRFGQSTMN